MHTRIRFDLDVHRADVRQKTRAENAEIVLSNGNRVHRLDCASITAHLWLDNAPADLHTVRVQAEKGSGKRLRRYYDGVNRLDVAEVAEVAIMHRTGALTVLTGAQVEAIHNVRGCQICRSGITESPLGFHVCRGPPRRSQPMGFLVMGQVNLPPKPAAIP